MGTSTPSLLSQQRYATRIMSLIHDDEAPEPRVPAGPRATRRACTRVLNLDLKRARQSAHVLLARVRWPGSYPARGPGARRFTRTPGQPELTQFKFRTPPVSLR